MTSSHDLVGMLRGVRKTLRRVARSHRVIPPRGYRAWTAEELAEQADRWKHFYVLLDRCIWRGLVNGQYRAWFTREHVMSDNWGLRK